MRDLKDFIIILLNQNGCILIHIPPKYVSTDPIDTWPALIQIMAFHWTGYGSVSVSLMA